MWRRLDKLWVLAKLPNLKNRYLIVNAKINFFDQKNIIFLRGFINSCCKGNVQILRETHAPLEKL